MTSPEKDIPEQEKSFIRKTLATAIGCIAVVLTGDPEGFSKDKKS